MNTTWTRTERWIGLAAAAICCVLSIAAVAGVVLGVAIIQSREIQLLDAKFPPTVAAQSI